MGTDDLVPPVELLIDGSTTPEEFISLGEGFTRAFLITRARLKPAEKVLDVGCGNGQKARVLASYLGPEGRYEGFDIVPAAIRWCADAYKLYPNFSFRLADVYSKHYNPTGSLDGGEFRFPYLDEAFDVVFLSSVFTHMLPKSVAHYFDEIARVLRPGGRCVATYFLLNEASLAAIEAGKAAFDFAHPFGGQDTAANDCRLWDETTPEKAVAHNEDRIRRHYWRHAMDLCEVTYGTWSGRSDMLGSLQDVIIAIKH